MSEFQKPATIDFDVVKNLGPLAALVGKWEGDKGIDVAPSPRGPITTPYREVREYGPFGPVVNGSQVLYGLRYSSVMWPEQSVDPFHEETGYWLWDPKAQQVYCCFVVPRGVIVNAGGDVAHNATNFTLVAEVGSSIFGIASNPFLDTVYRTERFELTVTINADDEISYVQDTVLKLKNIPELFHHTDGNTMRKVG